MGKFHKEMTLKNKMFIPPTILRKYGEVLESSWRKTHFFLVIHPSCESFQNILSVRSLTKRNIQ
jgi:hypothetical protein